MRLRRVLGPLSLVLGRAWCRSEALNKRDAVATNGRIMLEAKRFPMIDYGLRTKDKGLPRSGKDSAAGAPDAAQRQPMNGSCWSRSAFP